MIRPKIVNYAPEWQPGCQQLFASAGWAPETATWTWQPETTLLAIWKSRVVGFIMGCCGGQPLAFIDALIVAPDLASQGIGVMLWEAMIKRLFALGARRIRWMTYNAALHAMLTRRGYRTLWSGVAMEVD